MSLSVFVDMFNHATGPVYLSGPDRLINAASLRNYEISGRLFNSKKNVSGGTQIKETLFFNSSGLAHTYSPGDPMTYQNAQAMKTITADFRFLRVPVVVNEEELSFNSGGGADAMFQKYKDVMQSKLDYAFTDIMNLIEKKFVATPSNSDMESSSGTEPFSVFTTVTSDGLEPAGFTTVQGLSRTLNTNYRNQNATYTAATPFDVDAGIIAAFNTMKLLVQFKRPSIQGNRFENTDLSKHVIYTNREGVTDFKKAVASTNDVSPRNPDPYFDALFDGIPIVAPDVMDTQSKFTSGQPGYLFLNMEYIKWIGKEGAFFERSPMSIDPRTPDTSVGVIKLVGNLVNCNPRASGYVSAA